jgi:hypothetical protein
LRRIRLRQPSERPQWKLRPQVGRLHPLLPDPTGAFTVAASIEQILDAPSYRGWPAKSADRGRSKSGIGLSRRRRPSSGLRVPHRFPPVAQLLWRSHSRRAFRAGPQTVTDEWHDATENRKVQDVLAFRSPLQQQRIRKVVFWPLPIVEKVAR